MPPEASTTAVQSPPLAPYAFSDSPSPPPRPIAAAQFFFFFPGDKPTLPRTESAVTLLAAAAPAAGVAPPGPADARAEAAAVALAAPAAPASATHEAVGVLPAAPTTTELDVAGKKAATQAAVEDIRAAAPAAPAPTSAAAVAAQAETAAVPPARLPHSYQRDYFAAVMEHAKEADAMVVHAAEQMGYFIAQAHASRAGSLGPQEYADVHASSTDSIVRVYGELENKAAAHAAALRAPVFTTSYTHAEENLFDRVAHRIRRDPLVSFERALDQLDSFNDRAPPPPPL